MTVMRRREADRVLLTETVEEIRYLRAHLTAAAERTGTGVVNHVLETRTITFDTTGIYSIEFGVPIGAIEISNVGNATVTVHAGGARNAAPTDGLGVYVINTLDTQLVNLASRQVTLYGTAGQRCCYQAYTVGSVALPRQP